MQPSVRHNLSSGALLDYTLRLLWTVANLYKLLTKRYAKKVVVFMKQPWNGKFKLLLAIYDKLQKIGKLISSVKKSVI